MSVSILVTGGARSGKSKFAEEQVKRFGQPAIYIATAEPFDEEMIDRIALHQARRGPEWKTITAPLNLPQALYDTDGKGPCLVDCLTVWLSNLMHAEQVTSTALNRLVMALSSRSDPIVLVTSEVGSGIVPENALARRFRDESGRMNQILAKAVDEVYVSISGIPVQIKSQPI